MCRLLAGLLGNELAEVERPACEACVRSLPPVEDHPNPVVASLVYERAGRRTASEAENARRARVREWAADFLDIEEPPTKETRNLPVDRIVPRPRRSFGEKVRSWSVGLTTAPRRVPTLERCWRNLNAAGWDRARLFVDGLDTEIPESMAGQEKTVREPRAGAWPSYFLGLAELTMRHPEADAYLMLQDDACFVDVPGIREYLEGVLWPGKGPGVVSLYCSSAYDQARAGWHRLGEEWVWGATAFVFSGAAARAFLADESVAEHRRSTARNGLADIDWLIGQWAVERGLEIHFPFPSLVQHIGEVSTLWPGSRAVGYRKATGWPGQEGSG